MSSISPRRREVSLFVMRVNSSPTLGLNGCDSGGIRVTFLAMARENRLLPPQPERGGSDLYFIPGDRFVIPFECGLGTLTRQHHRVGRGGGGDRVADGLGPVADAPEVRALARARRHLVQD